MLQGANTLFITKALTNKNNEKETIPCLLLHQEDNQKLHQEDNQKLYVLIWRSEDQISICTIFSSLDKILLMDLHNG